MLQTFLLLLVYTRLIENKKRQKQCQPISWGALDDDKDGHGGFISPEIIS